MIELWTPDNLTPLHPDDAGAVCEECGDPTAAWYDTADGTALCAGCVDGAVETIGAICDQLQKTGGQHDA